uniref:Uncharacterized protein n=1 Tax=Branchiostoma floridae TaxID=7739 RepID=C3ZS68_BRAFL|eukprot:XP_002588589.1 hypothetical protein BRAFLDRAFT_107528 [Branchiostoma floridae]
MSDDTQSQSATNSTSSTNTTHNYTWHFKGSSIFATLSADTQIKELQNVTVLPRFIPTLVPITGSSSNNQAAIISAVIGSILILTVAIAVVVWCNWRVRNIPAGIKNNKFAFNNPTVTVIFNSHYQAGQGQSQAITESNTRMSEVSGNDNQYEDVDNINTTPKMIASDHDQTGRCQHRAITSPNKYTTAAMVTSGHNHQYENMHSQKGQSRLQAITESITNTTSAEIASGHGHPYEDTNQHNQTGQGQGQVITESNKNTTAAVVATCHGHQYVNVKQHNLKGQGQCQVITESTTNTTAAVVTGDHDQTGRPEQAQPVTDPLDAKNASYGAGPISSNVNSMYKAVGQSQHTTNTTAAVVTGGHDQTDLLDQAQPVTEPLGAKNASYGTGPISSKVNSKYKVVGQQ